MKILRTAAIALIGISLTTPSAHACTFDISFFTWCYQMLHQQHDFDRHDNRGGGRDCNHSGGGGGTTGGGTTVTPPISPKS